MESLSRTQHNLEELIKVNVVPDHLSQYVPFSSNGYKLQNICRICLNHIERCSKVSILSMHNNKMLIDMLKALTSIKMSKTYPEENLPSYLCETCQFDTIHCYRFKEKCEKSESILQTLLNDDKPFVEKIEEKSEMSESILQSFLNHQKPFAEKSSVIISDEAPSLRIVKSYVKDEIKEEGDLEVIKEEYLDDLENFSSENEDLSIVQNADICVEKKDIIKTDKKISFKHTCNFCFKKFEKAKSLKAHVVKKHSSSEYSHPCEHCKEVFCSQHDLEVHAAVHATGPWWTCNKCNKTFNARAQLRRHIQRHMDAKRFPCERCGKAFSELYALRRHARVHTGEAREKNYACHLCDKRYSEKNQLRTHVSWHLGERRCVCAACGKAFASARLLASHRLVHSDAKPYACSYCDKRFRHESTRNTHHRTHTGEKPYVCAVCGKTFIQNSNLTMHMRTHTGEKPYSCDKCGRKFATGSSLKNHQWRHTGEKPYGCTICGKRFGRQDLSAHRRTHGARAHACRACPKRFASAARLRDHARVHTGEKPFECASCTQKFTTKSHLVKHMKNHQKKKNPDKREVLIVEKVDYNGPMFLEDQYIVTEGEQIQNVDDQKDDKGDALSSVNNKITLELTPEVPVEVTRELVVQDDCNVKEILVVGNSQNDANYQSGNICLNTDGVNYVNSDVNLVTVNEGTTVKLYQLDQSLLQIHSSGGQVTISKITSKMTANF